MSTDQLISQMPDEEVRLRAAHAEAMGREIITRRALDAYLKREHTRDAQSVLKNPTAPKWAKFLAITALIATKGQVS